MNIILDTNIWIALTEKFSELALDEKNTTIQTDCVFLISHIYDKCADLIVFDSEGDIRSELSKYLNKGNLATIYFKKFISRSKITTVYRGGLDIKDKLIKIGFDRSDIKFLEAYVKIPENTIIISFDSDFNDLKEKLAKGENAELNALLKFPKIYHPAEANNQFFKNEK